MGAISERITTKYNPSYIGQEYGVNEENITYDNPGYQRSPLHNLLCSNLNLLFVLLFILFNVVEIIYFKPCPLSNIYNK